MNTLIINSLQTITDTYQAMIAFFYQKIIQTQYTNTTLKTYVIDYSLLLPSSQFIKNLNYSQVSAQIQEYINLCEALVLYIDTNVSTQTTLFYEQIQNTLDISIVTLNDFAQSLLSAQYLQLFNYTIPYDMGLSTALFINNINLDTYTQQASLNYNLADFNNIRQNTVIILSR